MPRIWKKRGREVPADQLRLGTSPSTSWKCCTPAISSVCASSTVALAGRLRRFAIAQLRRDHDFVERRIVGRRPPASDKVTNKNGIAHDGAQ